jgi:hypothetical protein
LRTTVLLGSTPILVRVGLPRRLRIIGDRTIVKPVVRRLLPDDPLVRWLFWLIVAFSIGAPLIVALILAVQD